MPLPKHKIKTNAGKIHLLAIADLASQLFLETDSNV